MAEDPTGIRNFQRLDPRITTSGRLRDQDLDGLSAIGVGHVINLALADHPEALADEADKLAARGIGYDHIPVPFDAPGEDHYAAFVVSGRVVTIEKAGATGFRNMVRSRLGDDGITGDRCDVKLVLA